MVDWYSNLRDVVVGTYIYVRNLLVLTFPRVILVSVADTPQHTRRAGSDRE